MGRVHVIGGGLAGLSAALALLDAGRAVTVYEASPHLGGRCRSYHDAKLDRMIDNGTHALAGANPAALGLLKRLGQRDCWVEADRGHLRIADLGKRTLRDVAPPSLASLALPSKTALARPGLRDVFGLVRALLGPDRPVGDLFPRSDFYRDVIDPLTVAALNTASDEASSRLLGAVLRAGLVPGRNASSALMPLIAERGLGADLVDPLVAAIERQGGRIATGRRIDRIVKDESRVRALMSGQDTLALEAADAVCLAVSAPIAARLLPGVVPEDALIASPIVNVHFVLDDVVAERPRMVGVLGGASQWLVLRGDTISITVSAATDLAGEPADAILATLWLEAREACELIGHPLPERPRLSRVVKERWATLRQSPRLARAPAEIRFRNLVLAGDWTATGLPFTIEGAIRSGQRAAKALRERRT